MLDSPASSKKAVQLYSTKFRALHTISRQPHF